MNIELKYCICTTSQASTQEHTFDVTTLFKQFVGIKMTAVILYSKPNPRLIFNDCM